MKENLGKNNNEILTILVLYLIICIGSSPALGQKFST